MNRPPVMNLVILTGTIVTDPEIHRVGNNEFPVLAFNVETVWEKNDKIRTLKWKAKAFGDKAEELRSRLQKGMWIQVQGQLSAYARPTGNQKLTEIELREIWLSPPPSISFSVGLDDSGEEKPPPLQEG